MFKKADMTVQGYTIAIIIAVIVVVLGIATAIILSGKGSALIEGVKGFFSLKWLFRS